MADFCRDCTIELFGAEFADKNDLAGLCEEGEMISALCEGCGDFHWFNSEGERVDMEESDLQ